MVEGSSAELVTFGHIEKSTSGHIEKVNQRRIEEAAKPTFVLVVVSTAGFAVLRAVAFGTFHDENNSHYVEGDSRITGVLSSNRYLCGRPGLFATRLPHLLCRPVQTQVQAHARA